MPPRLHLRLDWTYQHIFSWAYSLAQLFDHPVKYWYRYDDGYLLNNLLVQGYVYAPRSNAQHVLPQPKCDPSYLPYGTPCRLFMVLPWDSFADSALLRHEWFLLFRSCRIDNDLRFGVPRNEMAQDVSLRDQLGRRCLGLALLPSNPLHHRLLVGVCVGPRTASHRRETELLSWRQIARIPPIEAIFIELWSVSEVRVGQQGRPPCHDIGRLRAVEEASCQPKSL